MKQTLLTLFTALALLGGIFTNSAEARGGGFGCHRGGGHIGGGTYGGCIRPPVYGRGTVCGPYRGHNPYYGYRRGFGFGYGLVGGGYLPCYDGGSPYMCDIQAPPPPPPPPPVVYIYPGGRVMCEYGAAPGPGRAPAIINSYTSSPGAKPTVIGR